MNSKHRKTLETIFSEPVNGNLEWSRIEALLIAVGCLVIEGSGSAVTFEKAGRKANFHRPHPRKEALKYRVKQVREYLQQLGVTP
ncbi:type II toxin-antitoxin system HicA family toxin [Lamprobacter modestohalophilus]|uniref:HicA protein n=1 Tax=Lamprobacter modestohalophilus TaxID=1064514 RepID=A0A9X0W7E1_9GAMM|nr:type II toxin-antitoxin system HicA family toxin [Lamprobacter modestohalophilus]MBK1618185.1 HicA protein [Lamprobacter modestohalophilus]MEA1053213.1 type II toxin-antitoxin system HicA family toxin [Lamprobacter modestohalophilus]